MLSYNTSPITQGTPLTHIFQIFSVNDYTLYPVVDGENKLKGITSLDGMKGIMISPETWDWILAADVMAEGKKTLKSDISLCEAMDYMRDNSVEEIPIVDEDRHVVGMLDSRSIHIRLTEEVVRLREE